MKQGLLLYSLLLVLTGCANRVADLPLVACGVDYDGQQYTLTLEGVLQHSLDGDATSVFLTATGDSMAQAYAHANAQLADTLSFAHLEAIVLSPAAVAQGQAVLSFLCQSAPPDALLAVSTACTPDAILQVEGIAEPLTGLALGDLLRTQCNDSTAHITRQLYQAPAQFTLAVLPAITCNNAGQLTLLETDFAEEGVYAP